jgi:TPR repeat protein
MKHLLLLLVLLSSGVLAQGLEELIALAKGGDVEAQFNLGRIYDVGEIAPDSDVDAVKWYSMAAEQGFADAQFYLGLKYNHGEGVPESFTKAVDWYKKAASNGNASAQLNLGYMFYNGHGVARNNIMAHVWWSLSKLKQERNAAGNLAILKKRMTLEQILKAQALASKCFESSYKECS